MTMLSSLIWTHECETNPAINFLCNQNFSFKSQRILVDNIILGNVLYLVLKIMKNNYLHIVSTTIFGSSGAMRVVVVPQNDLLS